MPGEDSWDKATPYQQLTWWLCEACDGALTEHQVIKDRHTQEPKAWCCTRCHTHIELKVTFPATQAPDGKAQIEDALKTLAVYAPIFTRVDQKRLYTVTGRFFAAGWCVKDILRAVDYRPDDSPHETAALNARDSGDVTLARIATRLRQWIWRDRFDTDEGGDIMPGPYTAMRHAMRTRHEEHQIRAFGRAIDWSEQERLAVEARAKGAPAIARRQVVLAQQLAKHQKREGDLREAAALAEQLAWARSRSHRPTVDEVASSYWAGQSPANVHTERALSEVDDG